MEKELILESIWKTTFSSIVNLIVHLIKYLTISKKMALYWVTVRGNKLHHKKEGRVTGPWVSYWNCVNIQVAGNQQEGLAIKLKVFLFPGTCWCSVAMLPLGPFWPRWHGMPTRTTMTSGLGCCHGPRLGPWSNCSSGGLCSCLWLMLPPRVIRMSEVWAAT